MTYDLYLPTNNKLPSLFFTTACMPSSDTGVDDWYAVSDAGSIQERERESIGFFNLYIFQMCMYSQSLRPDGQASKTGSYSLLIIIVRQWGLGLA